MRECGEIRELLSLAAAGGLDAESERRVGRHTNECAACAAELDNWRLLAGRLRRIPTRQPAAAIVQRAQARAEFAFAEEAERRRYHGILVLAVALAWVITGVSWLIVPLLTGGLQLWLGTRAPQAGYVFGGVMVVGWLAGAIAAAVLAWHQAEERRLT